MLLAFGWFIVLVNASIWYITFFILVRIERIKKVKSELKIITGCGVMVQSFLKSTGISIVIYRCF
jgi:fructose-1-phosphate kinase PfkB-like protein